MKLHYWLPFLVTLLLLPLFVGAQGPGVYIRTDCTTITTPVTGQSICFDSTRNAGYHWDGTGWQSDAALATRVFNIKDPRWGAKGDRVTDDTAAFQAVAALTTPGCILIPPGTYVVKAMITWKSSVCGQFSGWPVAPVTTIDFQGATAGFTFATSGTGWENLSFSNTTNDANLVFVTVAGKFIRGVNFRIDGDALASNGQVGVLLATAGVTGGVTGASFDDYWITGTQYSFKTTGANNVNGNFWYKGNTGGGNTTSIFRVQHTGSFAGNFINGMYAGPATNFFDICGTIGAACAADSTQPVRTFVSVFFDTVSYFANLTNTTGWTANNTIVLDYTALTDFFNLNGQAATIIGTGTTIHEPLIDWSYTSAGTKFRVMDRTGGTFLAAGSAITVTNGGGLQVGAPTGGDKGANTTNLKSTLFFNGVNTVDNDGSGNLLVGNGYSNLKTGALMGGAGTFTVNGGMQVGAPTGGDKGVGTLNVSGGYYSGGTAGQSVTITVRAAGGAADCTLIFTSGLKTGGTC